MPWAGRVGFLMMAVMTGFISSHHCAKHVIFMPHKYHVFSEHPENDPTKTIWQPIHGHWTNQLHYVPFFGIAICLGLCQFLLHGPAVRFRRHASPERWRRFWSASISGFSVCGTERMVFCNHWLACVDRECKKLRKRSCCGNWDSHWEHFYQRIVSCSCGHCDFWWLLSGLPSFAFVSLPSQAARNHMRSVQNPSLIPWNTGWFIGIPLLDHETIPKIYIYIIYTYIYQYNTSIYIYIYINIYIYR